MIWQMCIEKAKSIELQQPEQQPSGWQANSQAAWRLAAVTCWHLPVTSCQALNILAHEFSQSLRHNSAKHEKRISKTESQSE